MALKLKPLADRLVVEPIEREDMTASGIYVPETAKEKPQEGKVLAVGPGRKDDDGKRIPMDVAEGDRVLYRQVRRQRGQAGGQEGPDPQGKRRPGHPGMTKDQ